MGQGFAHHRLPENFSSLAVDSQHEEALSVGDGQIVMGAGSAAPLRFRQSLANRQGGGEENPVPPDNRRRMPQAGQVDFPFQVRVILSPLNRARPEEPPPSAMAPANWAIAALDRAHRALALPRLPLGTTRQTGQSEAQA